MMRGLDKITGRPTDITAPIGKPVQFATLTITARFCYSTPASETPETAAFVQIEDHRPDQTARRIFSSWMYGSSPGLNGVEHPLYDVWAISCNNNAATVMLALNSLAEGGEVIVSRGELVEIGGSFRVPDVMAKSNAILREVGTTNRTRIGDYEHAINEKTRLLLRVHRSNFSIVGFTEDASLEELVALGRKHNVPVMEDLGSGALFDLREVGIQGEPGVGDSIRAGVDVVAYRNGAGDESFSRTVERARRHRPAGAGGSAYGVFRAAFRARGVGYGTLVG